MVRALTEAIFDPILVGYKLFEYKDKYVLSPDFCFTKSPGLPSAKKSPGLIIANELLSK